MDRPEAKNAIGKEMLHGLGNVFELINQNSDSSVAMIRSSVPGVFCVGADLKVYFYLFFVITSKKEKDFVLSIICEVNFLLKRFSLL